MYYRSTKKHFHLCSFHVNQKYCVSLECKCLKELPIKSHILSHKQYDSLLILQRLKGTMSIKNTFQRSRVRISYHELSNLSKMAANCTCHLEKYKKLGRSSVLIKLLGFPYLFSKRFFGELSLFCYCLVINQERKGL